LKRSEIGAARQRAVDAGGADFQHVLRLDRILDVELRGNGAGKILAIAQGHRLAILALGHDLKRRPVAARDDHAHEFVAHRIDGGFDQVGERVVTVHAWATGFLGSSFGTPVSARAGNKKVGRWAHLLLSPEANLGRYVAAEYTDFRARIKWRIPPMI
jgi:hypothetical protein